MEGQNDNERNEDEDPRETGLEKVKYVYCPMNWISEIEAEGYKLRFFDDMAFVEQMAEDPCFLETVRELFDNAKNHVFVKYDNRKASTIMTITRELTRPAECCCYLADEIESGRYSLDVVLKAEGEIRKTEFILSPFVLKDQEIEEDEELLLSHFHTLTIQYQKVVEAGAKVIEHGIHAEKNANYVASRCAH